MNSNSLALLSILSVAIASQQTVCRRKAKMAAPWWSSNIQLRRGRTVVLLISSLFSRIIAEQSLPRQLPVACSGWGDGAKVTRSDLVASSDIRQIQVSSAWWKLRKNYGKGVGVLRSVNVRLPASTIFILEAGHRKRICILSSP